MSDDAQRPRLAKPAPTTNPFTPELVCEPIRMSLGRALALFHQVGIEVVGPLEPQSELLPREEPESLTSPAAVAVAKLVPPIAVPAWARQLVVLFPQGHGEDLVQELERNRREKRGGMITVEYELDDDGACRKARVYPAPREARRKGA